MIRWLDWTFVIAAGVLLVGLAIAFALDLTRRKRMLERIGHVPQLRKMAETASLGRRGVKMALLTGGVTLVCLSLARPQVEGESLWKQRGFDVALVVDFSKSMLAQDVYPSRIERAKLAAEEIIDSLGGDRVAVVAFAGAAVHYPLTTDYEAAKILLRGLTPMDLPGGSDLGEALLKARCILRPDVVNDPDCVRIGGRGQGGAPLDGDRPARRPEVVAEEDRARAIILFTDGEDTEGAARVQAHRAAELGIDVFVVGIGTPLGDQIPEFDRFGNQRGWKLSPDGSSYHRSRLDESTLREIARAGGGEDHYLRDDPRRIDTSRLRDMLSRLKQGDLESRVLKQYDEAYQWLLFPGLMLLLIEACLSDRKRRRRGSR